MSDLDGRIVWLVETGAYEDRCVVGVYASAEDAIAAHPVRRVVPPDFKRSAYDASRPGGWQYEDGTWSNGLDWGDSARCFPMTIGGEPVGSYEVVLNIILANLGGFVGRESWSTFEGAAQATAEEIVDPLGVARED